MTDQTLQEQGDTVLLSYGIVAWRDCCSTPLRARCASTYLSDDGTWYRLSHERDVLDGSDADEKAEEKVELLRGNFEIRLLDKLADRSDFSAQGPVGLIQQVQRSLGGDGCGEFQLRLGHNCIAMLRGRSRLPRFDLAARRG